MNVSKMYDMLQFYRNHPVIAAYDLLNIDLAPVQRTVFRDILEKQFVIFVGGRGSGKTYLLSASAVLRCLLYPGTRAGFLSSTFRQSKNVFNETERLYDKSSIFREACKKGPTKASDSCYVKFNAPKEGIGSYIEALPLGIDGSKIRGSRFHMLCLDEFPHIPSDIYDLVIRPMGATVADPMSNVRRIERRKKLETLGILDVGEEGPIANKIIMASSGYFKFNHMWKRMKEYWGFIKSGNNKYAVHQVPYNELPEGFLDKDQLEDAKRTMSSLQFIMEYGAMMVSDSDGIFKASLIDACTRRSLFSPMLVGELGKNYVMGIDPARTSDAFGIVVIELGPPHRVVYASGTQGMSFQQASNQVRYVFKKFNVIRMFMDSQGGGHTIRDLLEVKDDDGLAIIERSKALDGADGVPVLELIHPTPQNISDSNFSALALLESRNIWFPRPPMESDDNEDRIYEVIEEMKKQMMNIRVTSTRTGLMHFDTPAKGQRKDLYSAFILGCLCISRLNREESSSVVDHSLSSGVVIPVSDVSIIYDTHNPEGFFVGGALLGSRRIKK